MALFEHISEGSSEQAEIANKFSVISGKTQIHGGREEFLEAAKWQWTEFR